MKKRYESPRLEAEYISAEEACANLLSSGMIEGGSADMEDGIIIDFPTNPIRPPSVDRPTWPWL